MVFIEPAPYIVRFIETMREHWNGLLDVLFLRATHSQAWKIQLDTRYKILPQTKGAMQAWLRQRPLKENYDLIFLTGWGDMRCLVFFALARLHKIPLVVDSDTPLLPNVSRWKRMVKRLIYPHLFRVPQLFLPAGNRQAAYLQHYKVPQHKIILEKMTVDVKGIQSYLRSYSDDVIKNLRSELGIMPDDFVFLFVGRLIERKGVNELLRVFKDLPDPHLKLMIIGDGPLRDTVLKFALESESIIYGGWLEQEALLDAYARSDAFVLPAHWEPWGLVINEALSAGKPVIVTSEVGCIDDLVINQNTGIIIPPHDITALHDAVLQLSQSTERYQQMSKACVSLISEWTLDHQATQVKKAWQAMLPCPD